MKKEIVSNYDKLCLKWQQEFLQLNIEERYHTLGLQGYNPECYTISYFGIPYTIDPITGLIKNAKDPNRIPSFSVQMAIYHLFYYSKEHPYNSGNWIPFRDVKRAGAFTPAYLKLVIKPFAEHFNGHPENLKKTGDLLGFLRAPYGDISFYVPAFSCVPLVFIFWDGDDEFPAQANILFDENITDYLHEETVVMIAQDGVDLFMDTDD